MHDPEQQVRVRVLEEAARWLEKIERTISEQEAEKFRAWLNASSHREAIVERCKRWHGPEILAVLGELIPVETFSDRAERQYDRILLGIFFGIAGIGLVTVMIAFSKISPGADAHGNPLRAEAVIRTAVGERKTIDSADGGSIVLNTATQVLLNYQPRSRDITLLGGEAAFDAKDDSVRPLRVYAAGRFLEVQPGGARFNVRKVAHDRVELTVVQGSVMALESRLSAPASPAMLRTGVIHGAHTFGASEGGTLGAGWQLVWPLSAEELRKRIEWQSGRVSFDDEPLVDALREVERYTTARFEIAEHGLRAVRLSASFEAGDVEAFRRYLREELGIASKATEPDTIILTSSPSRRARPADIDCHTNYSCRRLEGAPHVRFIYGQTEAQ